MTRLLTITGSTGSVGQSALSVVEYANNCGDQAAFQIEALTAHSNVQKLACQAIAHQAKLAVIADAALYGDLKQALAGSGIEAAAGADAIAEAACRPVDRVLAAIVGIAGLKSTHAALSAGNSVALANKESMVCAGNLLKAAAIRTGAAIVPTDSEHNAMFQVLERHQDVERLTLTASGGPFLDMPLDRLKTVTPDQACAHPKWSMGRKISVDSASFMNKALELIEAAYLFDMPESRIDVLVHPQSVIHSLVSYIDGSVLAQLGSPDMQTPIAHALSWPDRRIPTTVTRLKLAELGSLDFRPVDEERFPAIAFARTALRSSEAAPIIMNAANEIAVEAFLGGRCGFTDINWIVEAALANSLGAQSFEATIGSLEEVAEIDQEARVLGASLVEQARSRTWSSIQ